MPETAGRPFRVLFSGRCEREKGVFDVLELARGGASVVLLEAGNIVPGTPTFRDTETLRQFIGQQTKWKMALNRSRVLR